MSKNNPQTSKNFFGIFINLLGVISAILYFAGWIYRLAYFRRFEINVMELEFGFETFLLIPVTTLLSDLLNIVLFTSPTSIILGLLSFVLFGFILFLSYRAYSIWIEQVKLDLDKKQNLASRVKNSWFGKELANFYRLLISLSVIQVLLVSFALFVLFGFAWIKGFVDGARDINDETSLLPEVTLVSTNLSPSSTDKLEILGNTSSAKSLLSSKKNISERVWRLLLRQGDWIYVVSTVKQGSEESPKVLAISKGEGGDKVLILKSSKS
jgi:hypothetical protein